MHKSYSAFCEALGARPKIGYAWCAHSNDSKRAVFTIWSDQVVDKTYEMQRHYPRLNAQQNHFAADRFQVIERAIELGHDCIGILLDAADVDAATRERKKWYEDFVYLLRFRPIEDGYLARITATLRVEEILKGTPLPDVLRVEIGSALHDLDPPPGEMHPERFAQIAKGFRRDEAVRIFVHRRANGLCEYCGKADFLKLDGEPYLETHHVIHLASQGPDTPDNVIALCARHHREAHFGERAEFLEKAFLERLRRSDRGKGV